MRPRAPLVLMVQINPQSDTNSCITHVYCYVLVLILAFLFQSSYHGGAIIHLAMPVCPLLWLYENRHVITNEGVEGLSDRCRLSPGFPRYAMVSFPRLYYCTFFF